MKAPTSPFALLAFTFLACEAQPQDKPEVRARWEGHYTGVCNSYLTSPVTGHLYCASPAIGFSTAAAYAAAAPAKADESAFVGFDQKSPEERSAILTAEGEKVYLAQCSACHQAAGTGLAPTFPPLVNDPVANGGSADEHISIVLNGLSGKAINGVMYAGVMTPFASQLSDNQIAAVVSYERTSWGNAGGIVEPAQVAALRAN
jgi:mono/diheme cytochrome c family protein